MLVPECLFFISCTILPKVIVSALTVREPPDPCIPTPCGSYTNCRVVADRAVCSCLPDYFGDPDVGCKPECTINSECPLSKACINYKCKDPCAGLCGYEAVCTVISHTPRCSCPDGFTGDPLKSCLPKKGKYWNEAHINFFFLWPICLYYICNGFSNLCDPILYQFVWLLTWLQLAVPNRMY